MAKIAINIATGTIQKEEIIVGIDLGTTNSLVAIIHPETKQAIALKDIDETTLVPSLIHFGEHGEISVGNHAKPFLKTDSKNTIYSVKRLMGKTYKDIKNQTIFAYKIIDNENDELVKIQIGNQFYSPIELSSFILKELKHRAEHVLKMNISKCVITVPAFFNDAQRQATRDAGKLAGLEVLRIINEPTAASLAYGIGAAKSDETKNVAVYDLGGGTFDISILKITDGIFDVLSTHGDTYLGGDDFDNEIANHFKQQLALTDDELNSYPAIHSIIRIEAEQAKKALSTQDHFQASILEKQISITKNEFENLIKPLVEKTITSCATALKESELPKEEIDVVVMVGGSTRVPYVKQKVKEFFGKDVFDNVNPDEVVALGAAIQADILAGNNKDVLLLDITPLSLGIETMGGLMDVLIPRNSKIPSRAGRQYTTQKDGQSSMRIAVYQGERDLVKDNRKLAEFNLTGIPGMPAGLPKVDIQFLINADGILQVKAKELRSGVEQIIEVKPQYGLTDQEVETMLMASITHAKDDILMRSLVEATTEGQTQIELTQNFLAKHKQYITQAEMVATEQAIQNILTAIDLKDKNAIIKANEELNTISSPYAERVMDIAVAEAMKGKKV